jgi:hypothetical protein
MLSRSYANMHRELHQSQVGGSGHALSRDHNVCTHGELRMDMFIAKSFYAWPLCLIRHLDGAGMHEPFGVQQFATVAR